MRLDAKPLLSISLFHPSSSLRDRFTVLNGFTDQKHCYYLHLASSHLLPKKMVCSQTEGNENLHVLSIFLSPEMSRFISEEVSSGRNSRQGDRSLVSRLKEMI